MRMQMQECKEREGKEVWGESARAGEFNGEAGASPMAEAATTTTKASTILLLCHTREQVQQRASVCVRECVCVCVISALHYATL